MSMRDDLAHCAREAVEVVACGGRLPIAALVVTSVVLGFELVRG